MKNPEPASGVKLNPSVWPEDLPGKLRKLKPGEFLSYEDLGVYFASDTKGWVGAHPNQRAIYVHWDPSWLYRKSTEQFKQEKLACDLAERFDIDQESLLICLKEFQPTHPDAYQYFPPDEEQVAVESWFASNFEVENSWRNSSPGISFIIKDNHDNQSRS